MEKPVFHVVVQGIYKGGAFVGDTNKKMYWERILRYKTQMELALYAFSIFDNHAHFLIRGSADEVSGMMRRVGVSYSHWYRRQYNHEGSLFRGKPGMEKLSSDHEILKAARYIHQEPVVKGLVSEMEDYPWSSYWMYQSGSSSIDKDEILERLRYWGRFEDYMAIREPGRYLEEKEAHFGLTNEEAEHLVQLRMYGHPVSELIDMPVPLRNYMLAVMRFVDKISIMQLSLVSGVGRGIVQRITKENLSLTLFKGTQVLHCKGEGIPKEVLDDFHHWFILSQHQTLFGASDLMLPHGSFQMAFCTPQPDLQSPEDNQQILEQIQEQPSSFHMICHVQNPGEQDAQMCALTQKKYLEQDLFRYLPTSMMYLERRLPDGRIRKGLLGQIDLEMFSYAPSSEQPIRLLQEVDLTRARALMPFRKIMPMEIGQVVLGVPDLRNYILSGLSEETGRMQMCYDLNLMLGGGHLNGYALTRHQQDQVLEMLDVLDDPGYFASRFESNLPRMTMVVMQGGEVLAADAMYYEQLKVRLGPEAAKRHPARYVTAELIDFDSSASRLCTLVPVISGLTLDQFLKTAEIELEGIHAGPVGKHEIELTYQDGQRTGTLAVSYRRRRRGFTPYPLSMLAQVLKTCSLQYDMQIEYVDVREASEKAEKEKKLTFLWRPLEQKEIFRRVLSLGLFPRHAFSLGKPCEQRYNMEGRLIKG